MQRFRRMKTLQKITSVHANVANHFSAERHLVDRQTDKLRRAARDELMQRVHARMIEDTLGNQLIGHISRDSTAE